MGIDFISVTFKLFVVSIFELQFNSHLLNSEQEINFISMSIIKNYIKDIFLLDISQCSRKVERAVE